MIHAEVRAYPRSTFPGLWERLDVLIRGGRAIAPLEVLEELRTKADELHDWCKQRKADLFVPPDVKIQEAMRQILVDYPTLVDERKARGTADPFVVATAQVRRCTVVTEEFSKPTKPKIPDVCDALRIPRTTFLGLIRAEAWTL